MTGPVQAQYISPASVQLYVQSDSLMLDAQIDSLFSQRHLDAIDTGMTASILVQFRLQTASGDRLVERTLTQRLEHDIWEGLYRVIRYTAPPDTLETHSFPQVLRFCTDLPVVSMGTLARSDRPVTLAYRIQVNPITPEQQRRTRRWLNLLERGSLLEFFIRLDRSLDGTGWIQLIQFTPQALPHILPDSGPSDSLALPAPENLK